MLTVTERPSRPAKRGGIAPGLARLPPARLTPAAMPFMLPTLVDTVPRGPEWVFELKWDGVRVLALRTGGRVRFWSRNGIDVTARYRELADAIATLPGGDLALDAEVVALDKEGRSSFQLLQRRMHTERAGGEQRIHALVFDCLAFHGRDVRGLPLGDRKALLPDLLRGKDPVRYSDHLATDGDQLLQAACAAGLEGIVAKRADCPYVGGRRREWLKIKCHLEQEFVIGGWTDPKGTRAYLGAVHLGVYEDGKLVYAGRAGTGLDTARLKALYQKLRALETKTYPFTGSRPPRGPEHHWARPELVCQVRFTEWTGDGQLRHPVFLGLRDDKPPAEVRRERPAQAR
jgi:bifunctional non-homologous end joining protein LigD